MLPDGKQLGGAPANFAYMTSLLGDEGIVVSRVGSDALGRAAGRRLERLGLRASHLQLDRAYPTGTVKVSVDPAGQPTFEIAESVAWDSLNGPRSGAPLLNAPTLFASALSPNVVRNRALRSVNFSMRCAQTLRRVFDVNLRQSFYNAEVLSESAKLADIMKVNNEELPIMAKLLQIPFIYDESRAARWLRDTFSLKLVCITRGANGSLLVSADDASEHPGYRVHVADTVGAGDAFNAALVYHYLRKRFPFHV